MRSLNKNKLGALKQIALSCMVVSIFLMSSGLQAQEPLDSLQFDTYQEKMDAFLSKLIATDSTYYKNGILYDRVASLTHLNSFNTDSNNTSSHHHFMQVWSELHRATTIANNHLTYEQVRTIALNYEFKDTIALGIINMNYTALNPIYLDSAILASDTGALHLDANGYLEKDSIKNPYIDLHKVVIAPLNSGQINGNQIRISISPLMLLNASQTIQSLNMTCEGQTVEFVKDSALATPVGTLSFSESGKKTIAFDIVFTGGDSLTTYAGIYVTALSSAKMTADDPDLIPITATDTYIEDGVATLGEGEYMVFLGKDHSKITKPIIITDGFDPDDIRGILTTKRPNDPSVKSFYKLTEYYDSQEDDDISLIKKLQDEGYDVVVLNFPIYESWRSRLIPNPHPWATGFTTLLYSEIVDGGADYIGRNAQVLKELIRETNAKLVENGSTEELVVIGPSMGGLISRIALTQMEQNNEDHNVRLWVSFDSPQKGANIAIGVQKLLKYTGDQDAFYPLITPAAKQMLLNHINPHNNWGYPAEHSLRANFKTSLANLGFPTECRNVATINGAIDGNSVGSPGGNIVDLNETIWIWTGFLGIIPLSGKARLRIRRNDVNNTLVFRTKKPFQSYTRYYAKAFSKGSLDTSPGGAFEILPLLEKGWNEQISAGSDPWYILATSGGIVGMHEETTPDQNFCFIPTKSSLAYTGPELLWAEDLSCQDLVCEGYTPFANYYAPPDNQMHVEVSENMVTWLIAELDEDPIYAYRQGCTSLSTTIQGPKVVCVNDFATYVTEDCLASWEVSSGVSIISTAPGTLTIQKIASSYYPSLVNNNTSHTTNRWVKAIFPDGTEEIKYLMDKPLFELIKTQTGTNVMGSPNYTLTINSQLYNFTEQDVNTTTDIEWEVISSVAANFTVDPGNLSATVSLANNTGLNPDYFIKLRVKITNECGTTVKNVICSYPTLNPNAGGVHDLLIFRTEVDDEYIVIDPDNPELNTISSSELFDMFGVQADQYLHQGDKVDVDDSGPPAIKVLKVQMNGKEGTKAIYVD